jgi:hypothetical protein
MRMVHRRPRYLTAHQPRSKTTSDRRSEAIRQNGSDEVVARRATQSYALYRPCRKQAPTPDPSRELVSMYGTEAVDLSTTVLQRQDEVNSRWRHHK